VFVGVFVYCVLVLRTIRGGESEFIPSISILIAIALALTEMGLLIYFIHHTATSIQVSEMASRIAAETVRGFQAMRLDKAPDGAPTQDEALARLEWTPVPALASGYIQRVDTGALASWAAQAGRVVSMSKRIGDFVAARESIVCVCGAGAPSEDDVGALNGAFTLNTYRDLAQDPAFGLQQLVDIALKALSSGVNDTGTARDALNYITSILAELGQAPPSGISVRRRDGVPVLVERSRSFEEFVRVSLAPLRRNATTNFEITHELLHAVEVVAESARDAGVLGVLAREIGALDEGFQRTDLPSGDKVRVAAAVQQALERIRS
jgi:uncharacterized membrane protein